MFNISKIQIESNSQLLSSNLSKRRCCVQYFKDTNRKQFTTDHLIFPIVYQLCSIFQRYKSKAIHNYYESAALCRYVVFNISKIQIESNSQLKGISKVIQLSCVQYFKDTNRKQFTTRYSHTCIITGLCSIFQRYKSKST